MPVLWSQCVLDQMFRLYIREGKSAAETARVMGCGVTRNAVLGKVQRLGWRRLEPRARGAAEAGQAPSSTGGRPATRPPPRRDRPLPPLREVQASGAPKVWTERLEGECAYPVGEPARPGLQLSCSAPAGRSGYCPAHRALMTVPEPVLTEEEKAIVLDIVRRAA